MQKRNVLYINKLHTFILKKIPTCKYQFIVVNLHQKEKSMGVIYCKRAAFPLYV